MGISYLRFIPKSSEAVPIDWSKVPEKSKKYVLGCWSPGAHRLCEVVDEDTASEHVLPQTFGDLVKCFHETKFMSYFGVELVQLLMDISKFGLKPEKSEGHSYPVGPRFYMKCNSEVWFLLFAPGEEDGGVCGYSAELPDFKFSDGIEVDDWDAAVAAEAEKDREVAENFDKKLVDEVSRLGNIQVLSCVMELKRLAGWEAFTFKSSLEESQNVDALMTLPQDHPVYVEFMKDVFATWKRGFTS